MTEQREEQVDPEQPAPGGSAGPGLEASATPDRPQGDAPDKEARLWATFAHLSGLAGYLVGLMFLGPLIIWLVKREEMPFVDSSGKEAINFGITILIAYVAVGVLAFVTCGFGALLFIPLAIYHVVMVVIASIQANEGKAYRYPATLRLVE